MPPALLGLLSYTASSRPPSPNTTARAPELLPCRIDYYAATTPMRTYAYAVISSEANALCTRISYLNFANAINRTAWWLDYQLGAREESSVITYFGPSDLRIPILLVAAVKTGRLLQICSPTMLSPKGRQSILRAIGCSHVLLANTAQAQEIWGQLDANGYGLTRYTAPDLIDLIYPAGFEADLDSPHVILDTRLRLDNSPFKGYSKPYLYTKSSEEAANDAVIGLHTSGTTGDPKPVIYTHRTLYCLDAVCQLPLPQDSNQQPHAWQLCTGKKLFNNFSLFHIGGIHAGLLLPVYNNVIAVHPDPYVSNSASAEEAARMLQNTKPDAAMLTPWTLEAVAQSSEHTEALKSLSPILYGGCPMKEHIGAFLASQGIDLHTAYGSTEMFPIATINPPTNSDWQYISFHPCVGAYMELHTLGNGLVPDLYELLIRRQQSPDREYQAVFTMRGPDLGGIDSWRSKDLWTAHPSLPGYWRFYGRADDMIAMAGGAGCKLLVSPLEQTMLEHPDVTGVVVGGHQQQRPIMLVEVEQKILAEISSGGSSGMIKALWSQVDKVNEELHPDLRFEPVFVIIADEGRPFVRTGKGSVNRKATLELYKKEVDEVYQNIDKR